MTLELRAWCDSSSASGTCGAPDGGNPSRPRRGRIAGEGQDDQKYLAKGFVVKASLGHLRDLPSSKLGVDVKKNFAPQYVPVRSKAKTLEELKRAAKKATELFVARTPTGRRGDRLARRPGTGHPEEQVYRVLFNEITERAVKAAFREPGRIDQKKVDAQQARRVLDRLVGYKISPLLWERVRRGLSPGASSR